MDVLVIVDMQNDFIDGSLGTPEAEAIVERTADLIRGFDGRVVYTMDTHGDDYLSTLEGRNLPVPHCIKGTHGWENPDAIREALDSRDAVKYEKGAFSSWRLAEDLARMEPDSVVLAGLCTDICVVSNAMTIKAMLPETPVSVAVDCCAGTTPENHRSAVSVMRSCQIGTE